MKLNVIRELYELTNYLSSLLKEYLQKGFHSSLQVPLVTLRYIRSAWKKSSHC